MTDNPFSFWSQSNGLIYIYPICGCSYGYEIDTLTEYKFIAYLNEIDYSFFPGPISFDYDYLIIHDSFYQEFIANYKDTTTIWGGFKLLDPSQLTSPSYISTAQSTRIDILDNISNPSPLSQQNFVKAIRQQYGFERFLKYYHVLELNFDNELVQKIKSLNIGTDAQKIGVLLNDYARDDIARLNYIVDIAIKDYSRIEQKLNSINAFMATAQNIFYVFGKKNSNPIKEKTKLVTIIGSGGFSQVNCNAVSLGNHSYQTFITNVACYWIYRIRCSIAHNKIGEYLMTDSDEEFVVEFGEPLIKEIICQYHE